MAIDSILNHNSSTSSSVDAQPDPMGYCRLQYPTSPSRHPYHSHHPYYHPDHQGYRAPYPDYSRASFSSYSQGPLITTSTESSPSPYSRDRYDSVSSNSSITAPTTASRASISSSATNTSTAAAAAAAAAATKAPPTAPPTATTAGTGADRRRPPRPKYEEEEMYFIWYHRVDLCQEWKEVRECFNQQFPNRQRSGFQGIQCKFYRFIRDKKCPTLREQRRMRDGDFLHEGHHPSGSSQAPSPVSSDCGPKFGVVEWMGVWYPWMRENREQAMRRVSA